MSLESVKKLNGFSSISSALQSLGSSGSKHLNTIRKSLDGLSAEEAVKKLNSLAINNDLAKSILSDTDTMALLTSSTDEVTTAMSGLSSTGYKSIDLLDTSFKNVLSVVKSFGPALAVVGAGIAAFKIFQWADDKYTLSYDTASKKLQESSASYNQTLQEITALDSELSSIQNRISELQSQPHLSFSDQAELETLQRQEKSLETQLQLKQKLAESQMKQAASDAKTKTEWKSEKSETEFVATGGGHADVIRDDFVAKSLTTSEKSEEDVSRYRDLQEKIKNLESSDSLSSKETKNLEDYKTQLQDVTKSISEMYEAYEADALNFYNPDTGLAIKGFEKQAGEYEKIQSLVSTMDASTSERDSSLLDSFFNGSTKQGSVLKDYLLDLAKSKKLSKASFDEIGISAESLGIENLETAIEYFNELASAADRASGSTQKIDGSFNGVAKALQSTNSGDKYVTLNDYLEKGKALFEQGLTGTDDFKTIAELISAGVDSSAASFMGNYEKLQRYMNTESNEGIKNFLDDLGSNGFAAWDNEAQKWNVDIDNTADAASKLGLSVETFEAILGRVQDYDLTNTFNFHSTLDDFESAKTSLSALWEIYENMDPGEEKKQLGIKLDEWQKDIDTAEGDLSKLDENFAIHLKLEYDLATLNEEISSIRELIKGGDDSTANYAALYAANEKKKNILEEDAGFNVEGVKIPITYVQTDETIASLQEELATTDDENKKKQIQIEITNLQEEQENLLETFDTWSEQWGLNAESSAEDWNNAWKEFKDSQDGKDAMSSLATSNNNVWEEYADVFDDKQELLIPIVADPENAFEVMETLQSMPLNEKTMQLVGQDNATPYLTLWNQLSMDPKFSTMSAQDQATYIIKYWNTLTPKQQEAILSATATDNATPILNTVDGNAQSLNTSNPTVKVSASDWASTTMNSIRTGMFALDGLTATTYIKTVHTSNNGNSGSNGVGGVNGTAHASGTAYSTGYWGNPTAGQKLVGELGPEIVVNPHTSRWHTVGDNGPEFANIPKNAIVFNHLQSASLLKNGYAFGRGRALAE